MSKTSASNTEWCFDIIDNVSRTFSLPIKMLPDPNSIHMCVGYLLCRTADTIEDSPHLTIENKKALFDTYRKVLLFESDKNIDNFINLVTELEPEKPTNQYYWTLMKNTDRVMDVYSGFNREIKNSILTTVLEMIEGMREFCTTYPDGFRIKTRDELHRYCYIVAGTVGHMLTDFNEVRNEIQDPQKLYSYGQKYGQLLQMVNIIKDVYEDYTQENNIYIPADLLAKRNVVQEKLLTEEYLQDTKEVVLDLLDDTLQYQDGARNYLEYLDTNVSGKELTSWSIPYLLSVATLRELRINIEISLTEGNVKMPKKEVYAILNNPPESYTELVEIENIIAEQPYHKQL